MSVRVLSAEGVAFDIPLHCFVIGSKATSTLHTVCANAAAHNTSPVIQLSQHLPQLKLAIHFIIEGCLPLPAAYSKSDWLELHRTSALLHYPTLRDAVEDILLSLSREEASFSKELAPSLTHGTDASDLVSHHGLTAAEYVSRTWQGLYSPQSGAVGAGVLGATGTMSQLGSTTGGFRPRGINDSAQDTMLPDPFGFTRRG